MTDLRVAVITGANRGIGKEILKSLASDGFVVIGTSRSQDGLGHINETINDIGAKGCGLEYNVNDKDSLPSLNSTIKDKFGPVSVLINNAVNSELSEKILKEGEIKFNEDRSR